MVERDGDCVVVRTPDHEGDDVTERRELWLGDLVRDVVFDRVELRSVVRVMLTVRDWCSVNSSEAEDVAVGVPVGVGLVMES